LSSISDPARSVLIAETSNRGSRGTYDPHPLLGTDGKPAPYDGFVIGWDTGNSIDWYNTTLSSDMPKSVTRLSFYDTASGDFHERRASRHDGGIHILFVDGHIETVPPTAAVVRYLDVGGDLTGLWSTR
jgi:prepilin-type processing-associated H-X9-DG protein